MTVQYEKKPGIPNSGIISVSGDVRRNLGRDSWVAKAYKHLYDPLAGRVVVDDINAWCGNGQVPAPGNYNAGDFVIGLGGILKASQWAKHNQFPVWCRAKREECLGTLNYEFTSGTTWLPLSQSGISPRYSLEVETGSPVTPSGYGSHCRASAITRQTIAKWSDDSEEGGYKKVPLTSSGCSTANIGTKGTARNLVFIPGENCGPEDEPNENDPVPDPPPQIDDPPPDFDFPPDDDGPGNGGACPDIQLAPIEFVDDEDPSWGIEKTGECSFLLTLKMNRMSDLTAIEDALDDMRSQIYPALGIKPGELGPIDENSEIRGAEDDAAWPITVPDLLTQEGESTALTSLPQAIAWFALNLDAISGQYPITLEVEDTDPLTKADQPQTISLPNQAEAIAELFGLAYEANTNSELAVNMLFRLIPEIIAAKNSALTTQDYSQAITNWLGFRTKNVQREIDSNFNPLQADSLMGFLAPSKYKIQGVEDDDPHTLVEWIQQIKYATAIVKASVFRGAGEEENIAQEMKTVAETQPADSSEAWETFIDALNRAQSNLTDRNISPRPRATSVDDVLNPNTILPDIEADT